MATIDQEYEKLIHLLWGGKPPVFETTSEDTKISPEYSAHDYISRYQQPVKGKIVSRHLPGKEHATPTHPEGHTGIDISAPKGTPIYPIAPGIVSGTGYGKRGGNWVTTIHENGNVRAYYAHLDSINVKPNQKVDDRTVLGTVGNTGSAIKTAPHLHLEVAVNNIKIDPLAIYDKEIGMLSKEKVAKHSGNIKKTAQLHSGIIISVNNELEKLKNNVYDRGEAYKDVKRILNQFNLKTINPFKLRGEKTLVSILEHEGEMIFDPTLHVKYDIDHKNKVRIKPKLLVKKRFSPGKWSRDLSRYEREDR